MRDSTSKGKSLKRSRNASFAGSFVGITGPIPCRHRPSYHKGDIKSFQDIDSIRSFSIFQRSDNIGLHITISSLHNLHLEQVRLK